MCKRLLIILLKSCSSQSVNCLNVECATVSVPQLPASVEEGFQSDTINCGAEAGPCRRGVFDSVILAMPIEGIEASLFSSKDIQEIHNSNIFIFNSPRKVEKNNIQ